MRSFTCKCGKVSQETKQYMVTTDCCGVGLSKAIIDDRHIGEARDMVALVDEVVIATTASFIANTEKALRQSKNQKTVGLVINDKPKKAKAL